MTHRNKNSLFPASLLPHGDYLFLHGLVLENRYKSLLLWYGVLLLSLGRGLFSVTQWKLVTEEVLKFLHKWKYNYIGKGHES
jgi:hypothetical protein